MIVKSNMKRSQISQFPQTQAQLADRPYNAKAARAAAPSNPIPISGLAAASGVEVGVAVPMAEVMMLEAEATADGSGLDVAASQISGARVVSSGKEVSLTIFQHKLRLG